MREEIKEFESAQWGPVLTQVNVMALLHAKWPLLHVNLTLHLSRTRQKDQWGKMPMNEHFHAKHCYMLRRFPFGNPTSIARDPFTNSPTAHKGTSPQRSTDTLCKSESNPLLLDLLREGIRHRHAKKPPLGRALFLKYRVPYYRSANSVCFWDCTSWSALRRLRVWQGWWRSGCGVSASCRCSGG